MQQVLSWIPGTEVFIAHKPPKLMKATEKKKLQELFAELRQVPAPAMTTIPSV